MSKNRLESEILFYANRNKGVSIYEKAPCPTKECFETIGQEGIDFVVKKIREMVKMRIYMFGNDKPEYYGLPSTINFAHIPSCSIITVSDYPYEFQKRDLQYPELFDREHFVIDSESVEGRISVETLKNAPRGRKRRKNTE